MGNVLVIGNGYDLAHGMKTRYSDFVDFVVASKNVKNKDSEFYKIVDDNCFVRYFIKYRDDYYPQNWCDFESTMRYIVDQVNLFFTNLPNNINKDYRFNASDISVAQLKIIKCFGFANVELKLVQPRYFEPALGVKWENVVLKMREELDALRRALHIYLNEIAPLISEDFDGKVYDQIKEINPEIIISFNYTDTPARLYEISRGNIRYVHGNLLDGNIVLGYEDNDEEDHKFIFFKKYFQRVQNRTERINDLDFSHIKDCVIHFYGLSMDLTDGEIIRDIFKQDVPFVIYYLNQTDYESKLVNLIKIIGKRDFIESYDSGKISFVEIQK